MNRRVKRIVLATIVAPLAVIPVMALVLLVSALMSEGSAPDFGMWVGITSFIALTAAYPAVVIIGLPVYFLLLRVSLTSYVAHVIVGALLSVLVGFPVLRILVGDSMFSTDRQVAAYALIFAACGAAISSTFRGIAGVPDGKDNVYAQ